MGQTMVGGNSYGSLFEYNKVKKRLHLKEAKEAIQKNGRIVFAKAEDLSTEASRLKSWGYDDPSEPRLTPYKLDVLAHLDDEYEAYGYFFVESVQLDYVVSQCKKAIDKGIVTRIDYQDESHNRGEHCFRVYVDQYFEFDRATQTFDYTLAWNTIKTFAKELEDLKLKYYMKPLVGSGLGINSTTKFGLAKAYLLTYGN